MGTQAEEYEKGDDSIQGSLGTTGQRGCCFYLSVDEAPLCVGLGWAGLLICITKILRF